MEGICSWISSKKDLTIRGKASTVEEALEIINFASFEEDEQAVAIIGINFRKACEARNEKGMKILSAIKDSGLNIKSLVFTDLDRGSFVLKALSENYGAQGFVSKTAEKHILLEAIDSLMAGQTYIQPYLQEQAQEIREILKRLTRREKVVLENIQNGLSNQDSAKMLGLSVRTIENHIAHIYNKAKVCARNELLLKLGTRGGGRCIVISRSHLPGSFDKPGFLFYFAALKPFSKSAMMSSTCSVPIERRIVL